MRKQCWCAMCWAETPKPVKSVREGGSDLSDAILYPLMHPDMLRPCSCGVAGAPLYSQNVQNTLKSYTYIPNIHTDRALKTVFSGSNANAPSTPRHIVQWCGYEDPH